MTAADKIAVLFLCTGNSCRSQMAEAMLRVDGGDRFEVYSAGSHPAGFVHGLAVDVMTAMDLPQDGLTSKSWDEFKYTPIDVTITLCDSAAAEQCPVWQGSPITAHWPLPDPAYHPGSEEERFDFAMTVGKRLRDKIQALVNLDFGADRKALQQQLDRIGEF